MFHRGANPNARETYNCTDEGPSVLYYAVKNQYKSVCAMLLEHGALPDVRCPRTKHELNNKRFPYQQAYDDDNDDIAAMLIKYMSNEL